MGTRLRNNPDYVFELFCEIGIPSTSSNPPWIIWKYPYNFKNEEILKSIPEFAYPVEFDENAVHHFSFVLTSIDSKWTFGFCRHAPSASSCLVLLSYLPWHEAFYRILNHISELCNGDKCENSKEAKLFLGALHKAKIPDPGLDLQIKYEEKLFAVTSPDNNKLPSIPENRNITEYFNAVDSQNMITIFASMLHERRILIVSKKLSRLSACIQAANLLIYPMHWQHIFIPVLPRHLLDYLSAPMPFLIGVPALTFSRIKQSDIGDVVVLQADENVIFSPFADADALPSEVLQSLRHDLKRPHEMIGDSVARAFLRASVKLIGGYWNALKLKAGEKISFSPELFVQTRPPPMQPFLEKMLELQIFQQFIDCRLRMLNSGQGVSDVFEFEITAHEDKTSSRFRNQYRDWVANMKKEGGAFIKSVRIKVKDTSKKAYKDIRSRIHDINHHHKIVNEDQKSGGMKRRGNSVPSLLFKEGFEVPSELRNIDHELLKTKEQSRIPIPPDRSKLNLPLSSVQEKSPGQSPILSFEPINVDLMDDLHHYFSSSCLLSTNSTSQRTSVSDPQLTNHFKDSDKDTHEDTPPPLLPRPPIMGRAIFDKPLIELDEEKTNVASSCDNLLLFKEENGNSEGNNPFKNTLNTCKEKVPAISPTNPFYQHVVPNPASGPNVKNMINMWQSANVAPPSVQPVKNIFRVPDVIPYRSQALARTMPTLNPSVGGNCSTNSSPKNPFSQDNENLKGNQNNAWENFQ